MFCKYCGTELAEDAKFCQSCGKSADSAPQKTANPAQKVQPAPSQNSTNAKSYGSFINLTALCAAMVNIIIRVFHNDIETVRVALALDDYYVVSETGRNYMITAMVVQCILSALLYTVAKTQQVKVSWRACLLTIVSLAIQVTAMLLRLPAPY